jgi:hypothetical protein
MFPTKHRSSNWYVSSFCIFWLKYCRHFFIQPYILTSFCVVLHRITSINVESTIVNIVGDLNLLCTKLIKYYICFCSVPQLRHDMIDQKEGETELNVKVHYDDMVSVPIIWLFITAVFKLHMKLSQVRCHELAFQKENVSFWVTACKRLSV